MAAVAPPQAPNVSVVRFADPETLPPAVMEKEYVSSLSYGPNVSTRPLKYGKRTLPKVIDELQRGVRFDIYETMMLDSQVKSCLGLFIAGVLGGGLDILPASKATDPEYDEDSKWARFVEDALKKHMETGFLTEHLPDVMKGVALGHRISEKTTYPAEESPVPGKMLFKSVKVKPRKRVCFVVDDYMNVLGIAETPQERFNGEIAVYPRDKFAILSWKPTDADPRGTSDFRCIYEAWWNKQKVKPMHLQFLHQFAAPSLIGETAEATTERQKIDPDTGQPMTDPVTGKPIYVNRALEMRDAMEKFQNNSILVIPHGAKVTVVEVAGDGGAFLAAISLYNLEMAKGLLLSTLSTEQGDNQGKAASSVHADVVSVGIAQAIDIMERYIETEFVKPLIEWNAPPGTAVPRVRLPGANKADFLAWASAISKLMAVEYVDPSQYDGIDAMLNLPKRSSDAVKQVIDMVQKQRKMAGEPPPVAPASGGAKAGGTTPRAKSAPKANAKTKVSANLSEDGDDGLES